MVLTKVMSGPASSVDIKDYASAVRLLKTKYSDKLDAIHRAIIAQDTGRILIWSHLNSDWKVGFIGNAGDCKTISAVKLVIKDWMLHGIKCYSNLRIKYKVVLPDDYPACLALGIPGGEITYQSEELDKVALFHLDEKYRNSVIFIDEINLEMAEARRASSNINLNTNKVGQELRHLEAALIYTVINEMWVDGRIRQITDVFVRTEDTALDINSLIARKTPGCNARWQLYLMSRKLSGETYQESRHTIGPYFMHVRKMWDAYDTLEMQASASTKYGASLVEKAPEFERRKNIIIEKANWDWLEPIARWIIEQPDLEVVRDDVFDANPVVWQKKPPDIPQDSWSAQVSRKLCENYGIYNKKIGRRGRNFTVYFLPEGKFNVDNVYDTNAVLIK